MKQTLEYKSYRGTICFDENTNVIYGKVIGINDLISYEGKSMNEVEESFKLAIDDYLETCNRLGKTPES